MPPPLTTENFRLRAPIDHSALLYTVRLNMARCAKRIKSDRAYYKAGRKLKEYVKEFDIVFPLSSTYYGIFSYIIHVHVSSSQ